VDMNLRMKRGRPREYGIRPAPGFADERVALAAASLDELRARVIDQIEDLPRDALTFVPQGTTLTIVALAAHLVWAEACWIERISGTKVPAELLAAVAAAGRAVPAGDLVIPDLDAKALVSLCGRVSEEFTRPVLARLTDIEVELPSEDRPMTPLAVLMHLIWHWTYHSAHIGLIREQWGSGYAWTFGGMT
jgi:uncharacterized damage-inducible protein DinB